MVLGIAGCTSKMSILVRELGCSFKKSESSVIIISHERDASSTIRPLLDPGPKA